jgi:hypothetical protein
LLPRSLVAAVLAATLLAPSTANAQSLVPPVRVGHEHHRSLLGCPPGISLVCGLGSDAVDLVGGAITTGAGAAANAVMDGIVGWAASGAAWLVKAVARQIDRSTRPALGSPWFAVQYVAIRQLAVPLTVMFLLLAIMNAVVRRDLAMVARACLVALPLALLLMFAAVTLVALGLTLTDELTATAVDGSGGNVRTMFSDLAVVLGPTAAAGSGALPGFVLLIGAALTALLALVVWTELILREAAIYVAVAFLPIALAALVWPRTVSWARRLAEWLSAIILAKFTIAASFAIAGSMIAHGRPGNGGLSALLGGCAVLLIAAFSPVVLLRLIPFAEQAAASLHRGSVQSAIKTAPGAQATTLLVHQAMLKNLSAPHHSQPAPARPGRWTPPMPPVRQPTR